MAASGVSLRQALAQTAAQLQQAGIGRARAEARLLAGAALGLSLERIVAEDARLLRADELQALAALAARRVRREPMAQILGRREFYGRPFRVSRDVLTPRPDSETLIEAVLERIDDRSAPLRLLDLGLGSGCLLLTLLAELPQASGTGIDISAAALAVARDNAMALGVADRCHLVQGDWSETIAGPFDIVISNPPYIPAGDIAGLEPEVAQYEPRLALDGGADGLDFYRRLATDLPRLLAPGGLVAVEIGQGQGAAVNRLFQEAGLRLLPARADLAGIERCILARAGS